MTDTDPIGTLPDRHSFPLRLHYPHPPERVARCSGSVMARHVPGTCAGWEGFFRDGLARHLDGRVPVYDDRDDAVMAARTEGYRSLVETQLTDR
jgi:hypothetical protein